MFDLDALARADARLCALGVVSAKPAPRPAPKPEARAGDPARCPHLAAQREMEAAG